jgi:hypothetical protein
MTEQEPTVNPEAVLRVLSALRTEAEERQRRARVAGRVALLGGFLVAMILVALNVLLWRGV